MRKRRKRKAKWSEEIEEEEEDNDNGGSYEDDVDDEEAEEEEGGVVLHNILSKFQVFILSHSPHNQRVPTAPDFLRVTGIYPLPLPS